MNSTRIALVALFASSFVVGCAVDTGSETATATESVASGSEALRSAKKVTIPAGQWFTSDGGAISKIEFTSDAAQTVGGTVKGQRFYAAIDSGIRCITTPCPSRIEVSGVATLTSDGTLSLTAVDRPTARFGAILGDYAYVVTHKGITLTKSDGQSAAQAFKTSDPFCVVYKIPAAAGSTGATQFHAENVVSNKAAKALVAAHSCLGAEARYFAGACNQAQMCPLYVAHVCGTTGEIGAGEETFGNVCNFQSAVRASARRLLDATGRFTDGECTPPAVPSCVTYKSSDSTATTGAFYAINVASVAAGQALLDERAAGIIEGLVTEGACNAEQLCTLDFVPVCRQDDGKQFSNLCLFNSAIRAEAGDGTGVKIESKGRWTDGTCAAAN